MSTLYSPYYNFLEQTGNGTGTVQSVSTGTGLLSSTGGPITTTGTISLAPIGSSLTAGSYTNANITVNAQGQVTTAGSGVAGSAAGATSQVQYNNSGVLAGQPAFTYDSVGNSLTVGGLFLDHTVSATASCGFISVNGTSSQSVSCTRVTNNSIILLTSQSNNVTGTLRVISRVPGANFTLTSSNVSDVGNAAWLIIN